MRSGYRNCTKKFKINSIDEQFNFNLSDTHLKFSLLENKRTEFAPVERVDFYLKDHRLIKNIFIVNGQLAYYYEKEWYYKGHPFDDPPSPKVHIFKRYNFNESDIQLIKAENHPTPAKFDILYLISPIKYNHLDSKKSIEKNIFIQIKNWKNLPGASEDDLFRI